LQALKEFGFGGLALELEDFSTPGKVVQLGRPPVRIDLITSISGVSWEEAHSNRVAGSYDSVRIYFLGRDELLRNKRASGRRKDLADLEALGDE
jgi:hypothetical protein